MTDDEFKQLLKDTPQDEDDLQDANDLELSTEDGTQVEGEISSESDLQDTNNLELSTEDGTQDDHKTHPETITQVVNDLESSTEDVQEKERLDNVRRKIQEQKSRHRRRV